MGGQPMFTVTDKYMRKITVEGPIIGIWLCNHLIDLGEDMSYIGEFCKIIDIDEPLFRA